MPQVLRRPNQKGGCALHRQSSYPGEEHDYIVTFTAPGPMYGHELVITFPDRRAILRFLTGKDFADQITVRAPGAAIDFDVDPDTDDPDVDTARSDGNDRSYED